MSDLDIISIWAILLLVSLLGGLAVAGVAELVDAVWAGRRRFPR
jgi:hypothetical protein